MRRWATITVAVAALGTAGVGLTLAAHQPQHVGQVSPVPRSDVAALDTDTRGTAPRIPDGRASRPSSAESPRVRLERTSLRRSAITNPDLGVVATRMDRLATRIRMFERTASDLDVWLGCVRYLRVDQAGDEQHRWGFRYDERDGSGIDTRPALVRRTGSGRPDLVLLKVARRIECLSAAPDPNGTGADARAVAEQRALTVSRAGVARLERRMERLAQRVEELVEAFEGFDEWESCLSWVPLTEYGDGYQNLGFLFDDVDASEEQPQRHRAAVDIDTSEWDDPDYQLLAFLGRDRPFTRRECGHEPGEQVDRSAGTTTSAPAVPRRSSFASDRLTDLRRELTAAAEDVLDLVEPAQEFTQFDECMFTVGLQELGGVDYGYHYVGRTGVERFRSALAYDLSGRDLPQYSVMAFPGEEPPQIECNEDAGGMDTDE